VDDVIIASNDPAVVSVLSRLLNSNSTRISVSQSKYTLNILADNGLLAAKPITFPMEANLKLSKDTETLLTDPTQYRRLIGHLI
jgi:hypothetical protein